MRVIVIDDEQAMHLVMTQMLSRIHGVEVVGCFQQPADAMGPIREMAIDLVFIDINLGEDNGLEIARGLRSAHPDLDIVFVTSHKEHAIDSFDSYPLDYMVKPVSQSRLEQTIARAAARSGSKPAAAAAPVGKLTVRALGGFEVKNEQGELVKWSSRKCMELFAYLLMHKGSPVSKSRIIEYIYPDMPPKNAAIYMNTTVYQLRKSLHASGHRHMIANSLEQYWLILDPIEADFVMFEDQASRFGTLNAGNIEAALACERLYAGELFDERSYEWAFPEQIRLHELYLRLAKQIGRWLLQHQKTEQAADLVKRLMSRGEWDEETHLLLLEAYGKLGDLIALARHYERVTELYRNELGIPTPVAFTKLYEHYRGLV